MRGEQMGLYLSACTPIICHAHTHTEGLWLSCLQLRPRTGYLTHNHRNSFLSISLAYFSLLSLFLFPLSVVLGGKNKKRRKLQKEKKAQKTFFFAFMVFYVLGAKLDFYIFRTCNQYLGHVMFVRFCDWKGQLTIYH